MSNPVEDIIGKIGVARDMTDEIRQILASDPPITALQKSALHGDLTALETDVRELSNMVEPF